MNLPKTSFLHIENIKRHKVFTAIIAVQCLVLLWLVVGLFHPAFSLTILPQDFSTAVEGKSDSQYQTLLTEESLQFQIADEAKRVPESEGEANFEPLESQGHAIRSGAYEVTVQYQTDSTSANIQAAEVLFEELRFYNLVYGDSITLTGSWESLTGRLWIPLGANAQELVAQITPLGGCNFQIQSITLQEQPAYRLIRLVGLLLLFGIVDGIGLALFTDGVWNPWNQLKKHWVVAALSLVCTFACLPLLSNGLLMGDDIDFHLNRIVSLAQGLSDGQFPVRLYTDMLNGYGYATPLYYCDLFLYIPAVLYNCMVPLQVCYKLYVMIVTITTAAICYYTLQKIVSTKEITVVGTTVYLLAGYRLCNVHFRSAVGEYTAMAWLPLVVLGMYQIYAIEKPKWRDSLPLAIGVAGIVQSHVLTLEMTLVFLILFCLINAGKTFRKARLTAIFRAAFVSIGLSAWFAIPMLYSMATQHVLVNEAGGSTSFQNEGTPLYEMFAIFPNMKSRSSRGALGAGIIVCALLAGVVLLTRERWKVKDNKKYVLLKNSVLLGSVAVVFVWDRMPWDTFLSHVDQTMIHKVVTVVQFPWRYLAIASVLFTIAVSVSLEIMRKRKEVYYRCALISLVFISLLSSGILFFTLYEVREEEFRYEIVSNNRNSIMTGEYLLSKDVNWSYPRPSAQDEELLIKWYDKTDGVAHITLDNTGDTEATVVLPIYDYGNYHAVDTEGTEWSLGTSENSLLQLTVPAGYSGSFSIQYKEPIWWRAAELVSLATFVGLVGVWVKDKKKTRQLHKLPGNLQS